MSCRKLGIYRIILLAIFLTLIELTSAQRPMTVSWSKDTFGPDGPWNAVTVQIGSAVKQKIALYAGAWWETWIIPDSYCRDNVTTNICYAEDAGIFNPDYSASWDNTTIELGPSSYEWEDLSYSPTDATPLTGKARRAQDTIWMEGIEAYDVAIIAIRQGTQIYPGGQTYPVQVGHLSLGAGEVNQTFGNIKSTFVTSWLWNGSHDIPSYSYGMHVGAASHGIPGSLLLGGYDKSRALGDVSAQPHIGSSAPIQLLDIELAVETGGSPWNFPRKAGLLAHGNSTLNPGIEVFANVVDPYIYLPQTSCDAIAAELPVTHNPDLGLYCWNTNDPQYERIVNSPACLGFTFIKDNTNNLNITIKVPFTLLNLTLEAPLVSKPTRYFPCFGSKETFALGRAFFQAAFIGVNYGDGSGIGNWFLAQAPGPGISRSSTIVIEVDTVKLAGSDDSWEETWASHWTPLPGSTRISIEDSTNNVPANSTQTNDANVGNEGLSTGAQIGIGAGGGAAGLVILGIAMWWLIRRRRQQKTTAFLEVSAKSVSDWGHEFPIRELDNKRTAISELDNKQAVSELDHRQTISELANHRSRQGPFEMGPGRDSGWV